MVKEAGSVGIKRLLHTRRWLLVAPSLLLLWVVGQFDKTNISLVITDPSFLEELALAGRHVELGSLMSTFFIGYGAGIFVWGFLVDRFGPRSCIIAGSLGWGVAMFLMSRATTLEGLLLARCLLGVAEGNLWPVSNTLTNRWFPAREHSRAQAFWIMGPTLGTALGVPVVTALMLASNWRGMMVGLAMLSLVPIALFVFVSNWPRDHKRLPPSELEEIEGDRKLATVIERMSFRELLQSGSFWLITATMIVSVTTMFTLVQWIPSFLTSIHHLPFETMSAWITAGYLLATALVFAIGYLADRTMQRAMTGAWVCAFFVGAVLVGGVLLPPIASALLLPTLTAVPTAAAALNGALLHTLVRPEAVARGTGIYSGVGTFLSAAGPTVFGILINVLEGQYWGGFLFLAVLNGVAAVCYYTLHRISVHAIRNAPVPATSRRLDAAES